MPIPWAAANAVLLEVRKPGAPDDSGEVSGIGDLVWEGEHTDTVLSRVHRTVFDENTNTPVEVDVVKIRKPPAAVATARAGDDQAGYTVLIEDRRTDTPMKSRWRVVTAEHKGKGEAEIARFELADAQEA